MVRSRKELDVCDGVEPVGGHVDLVRQSHHRTVILGRAVLRIIVHGYEPPPPAEGDHAQHRLGVVSRDEDACYAFFLDHSGH
eukprot:CAMPEP_0173386914 /NCGR_PEP_ID=MMETSP1356-20130122/9481_1 /TAXON_ID=77927 ORGANISM="Hemiselmis virescens, Strain PCC157" /NCGR_SAMPLE_ID=MMETSP1356 /ASSEMBLY_ACC=CAM_ASM_000847 /LENGTH=81 /DNA_ID=CAMNT_0014343331 /DNA_START=152 /DNA_END=394 /DNA_ORIENTATION=-